MYTINPGRDCVKRGFLNITGSIGAIVNGNMILSADHVIAWSFLKGRNAPAVGQRIIGKLTWFNFFDFSNLYSWDKDIVWYYTLLEAYNNPASSKIDAALATINSGFQINPVIAPWAGGGLTIVNSILDPTPGMKLKYYDKNLNRFVVITVDKLNQTKIVHRLGRYAKYEDLFTVKDIPVGAMQPGVSGSVFVEEASNKPVGMVVRKDRLTRTRYMCKVSNVVDKLGPLNF